ncbi:ATP-binding cassette domain-containing protein [Simkania negevensis]|uniref:ATP-binding cassette domain-containing protein n=1 Tax=Simkania negevensis TaxID=83561 RepID=A0ABS3AR09_9BACT|nr:ATP-binding cassette domain-containing protein [Simkania negevensis]
MIVAKGVWKSFGKTEVLQGLDLEVKKGETLVILGRSGVGKSVLLKHIIGLLSPDSGSIEVDGVCISSLRGTALYRSVRSMGMLFQGAALFDSMTLGENTAFYLRQHGDPLHFQQMAEQDIEDCVDQALSMVGLESAKDKMPSELSGGMRKRAGIARLVIYHPQVVLYDEPTTGLDPITAMQINELIIRAKEELHSTSVVVTHDIDSALTVGDRLALHHNGKIAYIADKEEFVRIEDPLVQDFMKRGRKDDR